MSDPDYNPTFGSIEFTGKDIGVPGQNFNMIAVSGRSELLLLSLVAEVYNVKRIRAMLGGAANKVTIQAGGVKVSRPGDEPYQAHQPGRVVPVAEGYHVHSHRLGYGLMHVMFLARLPGFMPVLSNDALWNELKDIRFTTPLIPEWMPYIEESLRREELLEDAHCYNCRCGLLSASTRHLDQIVEEGIQQGIIAIPNIVPNRRRQTA